MVLYCLYLKTISKKPLEKFKKDGTKYKNLFRVFYVFLFGLGFALLFSGGTTGEIIGYALLFVGSIGFIWNSIQRK